MNIRSSNTHHAKRQHALDISVEENSSKMMKAMPHKLFDAPPYSNMTAHGFESASQINKNGAGKSKAFEENVDAEAEDFIRLEHKKFNAGRWMGS